MTTRNALRSLGLLLPLLLPGGCGMLLEDDSIVETVTFPVEANFYTDLQGLTPDENCGDPQEGRMLNTQAGEGQSPQLGAFTVRIAFCVDASQLLDDGQLTEGESIPYDKGVGTFTLDDGEELRVAVWGAVLPSDHPDYDFEFQDPFEIVGGTGLYSGASGAGTTNSLVDMQSEPSRTQHVWSGTLTLRSQ